jgi:hypothetical protein
MLSWSRGLAAVATASLLAGTAACSVPFALDQPTTRSLEAGAATALDSSSFEVTGGYLAGGVHWSLDLQVARPSGERIQVSGGAAPLEAIVTRDSAYFRGREFLLTHVATDSRSQRLANAAGDSWWKGPPGKVPELTDFTDGAAFRSTFLGAAADRRIDHVSVDGVPAVEFSGPRADAYIAAAPPEQPLRLRVHEGVTVDGLQAADLRYLNFGKVAPITPPAAVIDFSNQSTLPPVYTVVSVDTSQCQSPCQVSAVLENVGGTKPAARPAAVTFTITDAISGATLGSCQVSVVPDAPYGSTTTRGCVITGLAAADLNAATVTATVSNSA